MGSTLKHIAVSGLLFLAMAPGASGPDEVPAPQASQKRVLVLYATRRDAELVTVGDRDLPRIIRNGLAGGLDFYSESMDQGRYSHPDYQRALHDVLRLKYEGHQFDVVVAMDSGSLEFLDTYRTSLFPGVPLVFFSDRSLSSRPANSTGVTAQLNLSGTLTLATALQPETQHVFVVSGVNRVNEERARAQLRPFEPRLSITYLSGLPTDDLERRLRTLPARSIVYYLVVERDGAGQNFHPLDYLQRVAAAANAPTYCWVESSLGLGVVGGSLRSQTAQAEALGALAVRVLRGERADDIPIRSADLNVSQVDWRQLRRWGISPAHIPAGTVVRFREPSLWDQYQGYIIGGVAIVLAQAALIAGLLVQRARRRHAEDRARGGQAELETSHERIRDLGSRLLNAQEAERARIARELHDDISQQLALLEIDLELLDRSTKGDSEGLLNEAVSRTQSVARSVHDLSHRLHPAKLRLLGLEAALHGLQHDLPPSNMAVTVTHDNVPSAIPPDLALCVFRIAQEALQNALKYSQAHHLRMHLSGGSGQLTLDIVDDGVGFDVDAAWGKGLGLISMVERLEAIGGRLEIQSASGAGTRLTIKAPFRLQDRESVAS